MNTKTFTICPHCRAKLHSLIEKVNNGYTNNRIFLNIEGEAVESIRESENFLTNLGYFCPYCDKHITNNCPEWV